MANVNISVPQYQGPAVGDPGAYIASQIQFFAMFNNSLGLVQRDPLRVLAQDMPSKSAANQYVLLGDLPALRPWTGDRPMGGLQAHKIFVSNRPFATGIRISREQVEDDQLGLILPNVAALPQKAERHWGQFITESLIAGFSGAANFGKFTDPAGWYGDGTCYDGGLFFSTTHTLEGGPNQSNLITDTLSDTGLENAFITMRKLKSFDGRDPLEITPTTIVCGPKNEPMAKRLCEQELRVRVPGDASASFQTGAESNIWKGRFNYVVSGRIDDWTSAGGADYSNYWFLYAANEPAKPAIAQEREPLSMVAQTSWESDSMFERGEQRYGVQARKGVGLYEWRVIIGSTGAG